MALLCANLQGRENAFQPLRELKNMLSPPNKRQLELQSMKRTTGEHGQGLVTLPLLPAERGLHLRLFALPLFQKGKGTSQISCPLTARKEGITHTTSTKKKRKTRGKHPFLP